MVTKHLHWKWKEMYQANTMLHNATSHCNNKTQTIVCVCVFCMCLCVWCVRAGVQAQAVCVCVCALQCERRLCCACVSWRGLNYLSRSMSRALWGSLGSLSSSSLGKAFWAERQRILLTQGSKDNPPLWQKCNSIELRVDKSIAGLITPQGDAPTRRCALPIGRVKVTTTTLRVIISKWFLFLKWGYRQGDETTMIDRVKLCSTELFITLP